MNDNAKVVFCAVVSACSFYAFMRPNPDDPFLGFIPWPLLNSINMLGAIIYLWLAIAFYAKARQSKSK